MSEGLLYLGTGEEYRKHAIWSAKQSQQFVNYPTALVTDTELSTTVFDEIIVDPTLSQSFFDKPTALRQSPFDKTLFLDCDAYIIGNVKELFNVLESFDIAASIDPNEYALRVEEERHFDQLPIAVPEYNTGVIAFDSSERTDEFFKMWERNCSHDHLTDQVGFRKALANTNIQFTALSQLYNCLINWPMQVTGEVSIIHDPNNTIYYDGKNLDQVASRVNQSHDMRVLHSKHEKVISPLGRISNWIVQMFRLPVQFILAFDRQFSQLRRSIKNNGIQETIWKLIRKVSQSKAD